MKSEAHKAKMAMKKARVWEAGFTPVSGKRSDAMVARWQLANPGKMVPLPAGIVAYDKLRVSTPANINRHTGKPHEHKREIDRNLCRLGAALFKQDVAAIKASKP